MAYVPGRGDVVWLHFDPKAGHEQAGHRLALVLSPKRYNKLTSLMLCCPLTTSVKGYPFEVSTTVGDKPGVVLADQVKSLDWRARQAKKTGVVEPEILDDVLAMIETLLF
ncbi:MAG: endoribonuclease MazF [Desulfuromonadales bacterium]|nr:endoribonuclease MazF [Desulfuromonadales bacterium]